MKKLLFAGLLAIMPALAKAGPINSDASPHPTDPTQTITINPLATASINVIGSYTTGDTNNAADRLQLHNGYLYNCVGSSAGGASTNALWLQKFQITDPTHPKLLKQWTNGNFAGSSLGAVLDCHIDENGYLYALISTGGEGTNVQYSTGTFQIWHLDNHDGLTYVGGNTITTLPDGRYKHPNKMVVSGNFAYIGFSGDVSTNTFRIIDFSNRAAPVVRGGASISVAGGIMINGLAVDGRFVRISVDAGATNNFQSIDVTNPDSPVLITVVATNIGSRAGELACAGDNICYAAAVDPTVGLMAIDFSSPTIPTMIGNLALKNGNNTTVHLIGKMAAVGLQNYGGSDDTDVLVFVDISSPSSMSRLTASISWTTGQFVTSIVSQGDLVFVGAGRDPHLINIVRLNSITAASAMLGNAIIDNARVRQNLRIEGDALISGALELGSQGLITKGLISGATVVATQYAFADGSSLVTAPSTFNGGTITTNLVARSSVIAYGFFLSTYTPTTTGLAPFHYQVNGFANLNASVGYRGNLAASVFENGLNNGGVEFDHITKGYGNYYWNFAQSDHSYDSWWFIDNNNALMAWSVHNAEQMRLGVNGLHVGGAGNAAYMIDVTGTAAVSSTTYMGASPAVTMYRCSGGTAANLLMYGPSGAEQTICTGGGGSLVALPIVVP